MKIEEIEALMAMAGFTEGSELRYPNGTDAVVKAWTYKNGGLWLIRRKRDNVIGHHMLIPGKSELVNTMLTNVGSGLLSRIHERVRWASSLHTVYNDLLKVLLEDPS